jgi:glycosyltransferase involved in cell wall biosynthesis
MLYDAIIPFIRAIPARCESIWMDSRPASGICDLRSGNDTDEDIGVSMLRNIKKYFFFPSRPKKIAIFANEDNRVGHWDPDSVKKGITGAEEAIIYISQQLAELGHKVIVFANPPRNSIHRKFSANPRFVNVNFDDGSLFDVGIVWRNPYIASSFRKRARKIYIWPHDPIDEELTSEQINHIDDVLWLSHGHREQWISVCPGLAKFSKIFGNGINPSQFRIVEERMNPYSCIYGSSYPRGLKQVLDIWPTVKEHYPNATLDIYYGWQPWDLLPPEQEAKMRERIATLHPLDVREHGQVGHDELNRAYERTSLWVYPCNCTEAFCVTALRAQFAGCIPVIIEVSALNETVRHGYKCKRPDEYLSTLLKAMSEIEKISLDKRQMMREFILKEYTWKIIATKWSEMFFS